jgi:hypothetical protein
MNRGVVLSIDSAYAIVFTRDCHLVKIPPRQGLRLGQEVSLVNPNDRVHERSHIFRPLVAIAAALFAIVAGVLISQSVLATRTYAVLSVDVNPSLQFSLNKDLLVMEVEALNEDASRLLIKEDYKGLTWQEAVDKWVICLQENGYEEISDVLVSAVMPEKDAILKTQLMLFKETAGKGEGSQMQFHVIYSNDGGVSETAKKNGLSVGMQMIVNQSAAQNGPWTADNIKGASLGELVRVLAQNGEMDQTQVTVNKPDTSGTPDPHSTSSRPSGSDQNASGTKETNGTPPSNSNATTIPSNSNATTIPSNSNATTIPSNSNGSKETTETQETDVTEETEKSIPSNSNGSKDTKKTQQ